MDELKAMITAIMDSLIEVTTRAVKAEEMESSLRAVIDKLEKDKEYWKKAYFDTKAKLEAFNDSEGT